MQVSIIIVNYNTKRITQNCINSIIKFTKDISFEIILVDNASNDESKSFFRSLDGIKFIESNDNLGFGRANNLGFSYSTGKYIYLLNSDTILLNNAVKEFYDFMESQPQSVSCLGSKLLSEDGISENNSYGYFPSLTSLLKSLSSIYFPLFFKKNISPNNQDIFEVDYIIGANIFIRRSVIEELGLFDPDFFMYFEETYMQFIYKSSGYLSKIISTPKVIHLENGSDVGSINNYSFISRQYYFSSMFIFFKKRYSFFKYLLFRMIVIAYLPLYFKSDLTIKEKYKLTLLFLR